MGRCCLPVRYLVSSMVFLAFCLDAAFRSTMSMTIISMVNNTVVNGTHLSPLVKITSEIVPSGGQFRWDSDMQGWVLTSIYIGILLSQLPAGHLAESFSLKWVLGYGVFIMSVLTILAPIVVSWNVWAFIVLRILSGISIGAAFPSANALMSRWSPLEERTFLITFAIQGYTVGTTATMFTAGPLIKYFGWQSVFYLFGFLGVAWSLVWYFCIASSPEKHQWISEEERDMILQNREGNFDRNRHIPWKAIMCSGPVLVLNIRTFCASVFYIIVITYTPLFLGHMFHLDLTLNGLINGVANITTGIIAVICSVLADRLLQADYSINVVRKTFATLGFMLPACSILLLSQLEGNYRLVAALIVVIFALLGLCGGSDSALPIDIASEYSGAVSALQNFCATVAYIITPIVVSWFLEGGESMRKWNVIFESGAFIAIFGAAIFLVLGSASKQDWSRAASSDVAPLLVDPL